MQSGWTQENDGTEENAVLYDAADKNGKNYQNRKVKQYN